MPSAQKEKLNYHECHHDHYHHSHDHHSHEHHVGNSWLPILVVCAGVVMVLIGIWSQWPYILMESVRWQRTIVDQLSQLLYQVNQNPEAMRTLMEISFLYGIFHSIGPGHGKVVVSTYLATHKAQLKAGFFITIVSALVQAFTAIALVSVFLFLFHSTMHQLNGTVQHFFYASAIGVIAIGIYIAVQAIRHFYHQTHIHPHMHDNEVCSCGHKHVAGSEEINNASGMKEYLALILSIGLRPCTGALLILFFAHLANMYWVGVVSSILMAVGTAITTSSIAFMTVSGKKIVQVYLSDKTHTHRPPYMGLILKVLAGCLLILFGLILMNQGVFGMSPIFAR
ncbi:nickel/cobalt transporter [Vibrio salinus]|uniref:nickel/cobalt transporter n=1 Tax=Vibrio salinus TaxID=2899784 RepID=UPI001E5AC2FD|nr:nickel/cobalt transporter [Vibrio salinus]MCE0495364.1 nickel/cobalt transporter [Vibrio salinus]